MAGRCIDMALRGRSEGIFCSVYSGVGIHEGEERDSGVEEDGKELDWIREGLLGYTTGLPRL